jgi:hypothetical protein
MYPANKMHSPQKFLRDFLKLVTAGALVYVVYLWINQPFRGVDNRMRGQHFFHQDLQDRENEISSDERRIAQHFAIDTLPGLMQRGLIKKIERRQLGTMVFVAGSIWKKRSRFFKESMLTEVIVYNKVNGYALETRIVDHRSQRLYAHALSTERKEFFD